MMVMEGRIGGGYGDDGCCVGGSAGAVGDGDAVRRFGGAVIMEVRWRCGLGLCCGAMVEGERDAVRFGLEIRLTVMAGGDWRCSGFGGCAAWLAVVMGDGGSEAVDGGGWSCGWAVMVVVVELWLEGSAVKMGDRAVER
ncbi:hypothetical protein F0562_015160 [Nyssa sinensis]|uniref:Uncharacterized protein n=1 Tax=Nyssa sinensis TaxID=561372 RepID=A0A5J4ZJE3_9ASTE|nr:hypothetical protein F0562_015160 [Nyssa sinensis]